MIKQAWIAPDGAGCYHFCYHISFHGQRRSDISLVSGTGKEYDAGTVLKAAAKAKAEPGYGAQWRGRRIVLVRARTKQHDRPNVLGFRDSSPLLSISQR